MLILEIPHVFLRSKFFSALDLNKFPKNLKIELQLWGLITYSRYGVQPRNQAPGNQDITRSEDRII